ncbi:MAG: 2-octaprenyl-3-methyl-6-methoxy-1,4-benzoquinol hydroxylase [Sodalis sp. Ffu]|nr:MAG: 2-octaprenyl-3-methyl-6-methoxy-1,4-benzoquinol hydroxylase [Sodalis sp. Ffu]
MNTIKVFYDVVVVGGGMVGSTLALSLAQSGFQVLVVELISPLLVEENKGPHLRVSAISCTSVRLLQRINVWSRIDAYFCAPYRRLETWELQSSAVVFDAASLNLPELGFMVENWRLQQALWQGFADCDALTLCCPASLTTMCYDGRSWLLTLGDGSLVKSRLLVGADGSNSQVRRQAWITVSGWQYRQSCILLSVETEICQQDTTWQVFTPSGPRAFIPLYDHWASLVWYDNAARIRQLQKFPRLVLEQEVQATFPQRLGKIKLKGCVSFPLTRLHACDYVRPGLVLVGDAAHTINPLAGQGANLGFRDAEVLTKVLIAARVRGERWDALSVLKRYEYDRRGDNLLMQMGIDLFYIAFSNDHPPLKLLRNLGLRLVQRNEWLKKQVLKYALGLCSSVVLALLPTNLFFSLSLHVMSISNLIFIK